MPDDVLTWAEGQRPVAALGVDARAAFIARTYTHLFGAIVLFVVFEVLLFQTPLPEAMLHFLSGGGLRWLLFLGGFMVVGMLASRTALAARSPGAQYAALVGFVLAEALIFIPLLYVANAYAPGVIQSAALITLIGFAGLTGIVFTTRKDFSFLRGIVIYGGLIALLVIIVAVVIGMNLGIWFSVAMIALAGASILWDTSNVLHHYPVDKHVAAALSLFASIALMFWYVLRLLLAMRN